MIGAYGDIDWPKALFEMARQGFLSVAFLLPLNMIEPQSDKYGERLAGFLLEF